MPFRDHATHHKPIDLPTTQPTCSSASDNPAATPSQVDCLRDFIKLHKQRVPYISQSCSWDCGLACVEMALRARGLAHTSFRELRKACATNSVWGIDIAYLLKSYGLDACFFTVTKGVRPEYRKHEFYRKQLAEDTKRVTRLFENADRHGIPVVQRSVLMAEIRDALVAQKYLVLVLLDKRLLKCRLCTRQTVPASRSLFSSRASLGFLGHYVLLYAYHSATDSFLMKDPAALRETCVIAADTLEEARLAFGTDQDILFIGGLRREPNESSFAVQSGGL